MIIECPYCKDSIEIEEINCKIFRHAANENFVQLNPHSKKEEIDQNKKYGCGMPFWYDGNEIKYIDFNDQFCEKLPFPN